MSDPVPAGTGQRGAPVAGRPLRAGPHSAPLQGWWARHWRLVVLVLMLPLFGQTMYYMKDIKPAWALSKAFPVLSLPLIVPLLTRQRVPLLLAWLGVFVWLVLVSSFIGIFTFEQNFFLGLSAQVKLLPMLHIFSFLGLLLLLRPTIDEVLRAFMICGLLTFATVFLLWALAPQSWYVTSIEVGDAPLLSADDRGNRIRMPMYFGLIAMFALYRRLLTRPDWRVAALFALAMAIIVGIVRTRAVVLASVGTLALVTFMAAPPRWRFAAAAGAGLGALALLQVPYVQSAFDTSSASGFDVRQISAAKAMAFLDGNPLRWLLGVGTITSLDAGGLAKFFNHYFFLGDISLLGIVFEFGLIGAGMLVYLQLRAILFAQRLRRSIDSPRIAALQDYVLFALILAPLYSTMTLQAGEVSVIAASLAYFWIVLGDARSGRADGA